uniref:Phorbol-ester/DAG-type domain-containing protein n=1 Tax=Cajanus cajan TaxID=3821 RepID=A0A151TG65_CAJCA|nr:hypothetical protein KK1_012317 [Cajanus cajan]
MKYSEISHFSHPQHKLRFEYSEIPFKCDGCKEAGIGSRYKCSRCDFDLHMQCGMVTSPTLFHPFYGKCTFHFMSSPPGDTPRYCNACEKDVTGFVYHCKACGFDLHPCCAKLPALLQDGEMVVENWHEVFVKGVPVLAYSGGHTSSRSKGKKKVKNCCEIAALALQFVISALLGDPTALIAGIVASFVSRA